MGLSETSTNPSRTTNIVVLEKLDIRSNDIIKDNIDKSGLAPLSLFYDIFTAQMNSNLKCNS